jgi:hypothetical protein
MGSVHFSGWQIVQQSCVPYVYTALDHLEHFEVPHCFKDDDHVASSLPLCGAVPLWATGTATSPLGKLRTLLPTYIKQHRQALHAPAGRSAPRISWALNLKMQTTPTATLQPARLQSMKWPPTNSINLAQFHARHQQNEKQ